MGDEQWALIGGLYADSSGDRCTSSDSRRGRSPSIGRFETTIASVERVTRIELALSAWEADVLPLNYTRDREPQLAAAMIAAIRRRRPSRCDPLR